MQNANTNKVVPEILKVRKNKGLTLSENPKLSIITTSFNLAKFIEDTMNSVENQSSIEYEHIVIDGASKDNSLEILKQYPHIRLLSEKDTGYPDAFWKGVRMARGKYVMQCPVTDTYASENWIKTCIETLDNNPHISLVWGLRGKINDDSEIIESNIQFQNNLPPKEDKFFNYFLKTKFVYPEGNLCARKEVMEKCYPTLLELEDKNILDWLEFSYRFNIFGFIAKHIPMLASYGRVHANQLGEQLGSGGRLKRQYHDYWGKIRKYRNDLILGNVKHNFVDHKGNKVPDKTFDRGEFIKEYIVYIFTDLAEQKIGKLIKKLQSIFSKIKK